MTNHARFVVVVMPNVVFFVVLAVTVLLTAVFGLPWRLLPDVDVTSLWRLVELLLGQVLTVLGVMFIVWGTVTLGLRQAMGEIGSAPEASTLMTTGAYAYCRHPISLGFIFVMPGFAFTFDFVPLLLVTLLYTPLLLANLLYEERELLRRFGDAYSVYSQNVPFLIPRRK